MRQGLHVIDSFALGYCLPLSVPLLDYPRQVGTRGGLHLVPSEERYEWNERPMAQIWASPCHVDVRNSNLNNVGRDQHNHYEVHNINYFNIGFDDTEMLDNYDNNPPIKIITRTTVFTTTNVAVAAPLWGIHCSSEDAVNSLTVKTISVRYRFFDSDASTIFL